MVDTYDIVFKLCYEAAIKQDIWDIDSKLILKEAQRYDIVETSFYESLEGLHKNGFINATFILGNKLSECIPHFQTSIDGFDRYIDLYVDNFDEIKEKVITFMRNNLFDNHDIARRINYPEVIVNHVFDKLAEEGKFNLVWLPAKKKSAFIQGTVDL